MERKDSAVATRQTAGPWSDALRTALDANVGLLRDAVALLERIDDETHARSTPLAPAGTVGKHIRHCVDFYDALLRGIPAGRIDYLSRERDVRTEVDRGYAIGRVDTAARALEGLSLPASNRPVRVRGEDDDPSRETPNSWSLSTVHRELQFVMSHTIHHYALVAMTLRAAGFEPPAGFGVAPSTLRHWAGAAR